MASDVNLNHANCIQTVSDFGMTTVHNICTGAVSEVPWGSADWVAAFGIIAVGIILIGLFGSMAISIWRE